jgi:hypothetical protein
MNINYTAKVLRNCHPFYYKYMEYSLKEIKEMIRNKQIPEQTIKEASEYLK